MSQLSETTTRPPGTDISNLTDHLFRHHGLDHHVDTYVLSYERGSIKPDGKLFGVAAAELGVPLVESLMVGDNHLNDGAAVAAGVTTLLLPAVASGHARGLATVLQLVRT